MAKLILRWVEKSYQQVIIPNQGMVGEQEYAALVRKSAENLMYSANLFQRNADVTSIYFEIEED